MDRDQKLRRHEQQAERHNRKLFPAEQYSSCPVPLMGLTYDWTALNTKVDSMVARRQHQSGDRPCLGVAVAH